MKTILFNKYYRSFNILSLILIIISLVLLLFKGLNYGVDFKGGTLIELRTDADSNNIRTIREADKSQRLVSTFGKFYTKYRNTQQQQKK